MSCKFNWHDLPNEIKAKIAEPIKEFISIDLYNQFMDLKWFNLPIKLNSIFKNIIVEKAGCTDIEYSKFIWFNLNKKVEVLCQIKESILNCQGVELLCSEATFSSNLFEIGVEYVGTLSIPYTTETEEEYSYTTPIIVNGLSFTIGSGTFEQGGGNLEVSISGTPTIDGDFSVNILDCEIEFSVNNYNFSLDVDQQILFDNKGIDDEATFISFLEGQGATNVVVNNFVLADNNMRCHLSFDGTNTLTFQFFGITKINTLSALYNLTTLGITYNQISTIENISNLVNLQILELTANQISNIENLENLTNLIFLNISENQISIINNLEDLINLQLLSLSNNQISIIQNLDTLVNLQSLYIADNQISTIENLDALVNLQILDLDRNSISVIENLENLESIETLRISGNNITTIQNLSLLTTLTSLYLGQNSITTIQGLNTLINLSYLELGNNQITTIQGLTNNTQLNYLDLQFNQITTVPNIDYLNNLLTLYLNVNQISDFSNLDSWSLLVQDNGEINTSSNLTDFSLTTAFTTLSGKSWAVTTV